MALLSRLPREMPDIDCDYDVLGCFRGTTGSERELAFKQHEDRRYS
jgi:hypothetical protein